MNAELSPCLRTRDDQRVPLIGVSASGKLDGLLFELTVEQRYRNTSNAAIETVYTFPLPLHAVLLGFELELNGTKHVARAFGRQQAERQYENAVDDGHSAALLVDNGNGLYTVNVANLKPGEEATVRYRHAELLRAHRNQIRLNLPTVIAPRYGNPADAHLEGPAVPGADLLVEYLFQLRIEVVGIRDAARLGSPSHPLDISTTEAGLVAQIAHGGLLDRDFVLLVDHPNLPAGVLVAVDGEHHVALVSAAIPATEADSRPLVAKILLDCSGSMAGDSIRAARRALVQFLGGLTEADRFSLTRFGSHVEHVTDGLEPADTHSIKPVTHVVQRLDADMGGTEMDDALRAVLAIPVPAGTRPDLVLITDGEVHNLDEVAVTAARSGHRLFVVAIGASPNEALARKVSERTGGACDFVAVGEPVELAVLRMFGRLRAAPRTVGTVEWSTMPEWIVPLPMAVFPGDTIHLMAGFHERPLGDVSIRIVGGNIEPVTLGVPVSAGLMPGDVLPRLAAAQRLPLLPEEAARDLAIRYQLVSAHTSLVLVAERAGEDKVKEIPEVVAVPQMLAAGWGGAGHAKFVDLAPLHSEHRMPALRMPAFAPSLDVAWPETGDVRYSLLSPPATTTQQTPIESELQAIDLPEDLRRAIVTAVLQALAQGKGLPETISALDVLCPLPEDIRRSLESQHFAIGGGERQFIEALLRYLDHGEGRLDSVLPSPGRAQVRRFRELRRQFSEWIKIDGAVP